VRRRSRVAWHELAVGGCLPLCIGVGLLRIEVVAALWASLGAPYSGTRLRPVQLVEASGVQSMGSAAQCGLAVDVVVGPGWRVYVVPT